ncbi:hypothetical protein P8C59_003235 [Phyllachora maydis]|uniref:Reverse transcriptase Ty1/copia-type domain-containing protein n=1 Tax=Phyllachora maydis TaxID=1825666 RepID=A0AAD9HZT9_9PEZI|nr:hypothetical protein P8C59_003235 [Phyllachora maydis]
MLGLIPSSLNIEYLMADILEESKNPAIEAYRAAHVANSSNSTPNSNSNPSKKGKNKKKGKKKASYNVKGQNYSAKSAEQASFMLGSYNLAIEEEEESDSSSNSMEIPSNSIRKKDYRPIIEDAIVSEAIEPKKRYKLRNSPAKGTTLEGVGPSLRGKRPCRPEIEEADFIRAFLNSALREEIYIEIPKGLLDLAASNKAIYKLLLKYGYNPSTPNIIKLSKVLYSLKQSPREWQDKLKILLKSLGYLPLILDLGVFYNAKTCYFIVTYIDDCLFIGPDIGYITDLKKRLNKVYAIEDLGPAAYFLGYLNSTKDYSICFSYNGNIVAELGPKLSNSSNTITKLSGDFYSKEGPRPLTTTSTTIVDSRNGKGSSRTSIINSCLVPIGFSDSNLTGDKATRKSTYGYLYKLAALYAITKYTLLKFRYVRE